MISHTHASYNATPLLAWVLLAAAAIIPAILLIAPVYMPIGAYYWDSYLYLDAQNRIASGQLPNLDFDAPVGPLAYYLFYWLRLIVPDSQPVLAASWSATLITIPLMAIVLADSAKRMPIIAIAVTLGFALYTVLPFNTTEYYPFPAADGFGIYNRHGSQMLYVLCCAILFMRTPWLQGIVIGLAMTALFSLKITAFGAGGLICAYGLLAGRISIVATLISIIVSAIMLILVELTTGIVSAYISNIVGLLNANSGGLITRLMQGISRTFGIGLFAGFTALALAWALWPPRLNHPGLWILIALGAGIFYESQNTGSQELIFLIPVMLYAMREAMTAQTAPVKFYAIAILTAASILPPLVQTIQHSARASLAALKQVPLEHDNLGTMGRVLVRPVKLERAVDMRAHWLAFPQAGIDLAQRKQLSSYLLFSDFHFQIAWAQDADDAITELKAKRDAGLAFETIMTLDFTNPFAWALNAQAPKHITVGADPSRTLTAMNNETRAAIADADIILKPSCPIRDNVLRIQAVYAAALQDHIEVELTPCYRALIHPRLASNW